MPAGRRPAIILPVTTRDTLTALVGKTLDGKYRIDRLIGRGGMGAVFQAEHVGTGRPVAVKTILPRLVDNASSMERFRREARAAGALRHPNIVNVTDFGVARVDEDEVAYLVMEYLEGRTLGSLLRESGRLPAKVVVDIVEQIALALDAAHGAGIVHRDLKPENIWLVSDARGGYVVRVLDFGIAKLGESSEQPAGAGHPALAGFEHAMPATGDTVLSGSGAVGPNDETMLGPPTPQAADGGRDSLSLTAVGSTLGTPDYMSPEQCIGENVTFRSDLYSLGAVAWQALVGRPMFEGDFLALVNKHIHAVPSRVDEEVAHLPRSLGTAVAKSLEKSPENRYPSARAMAGSLRVAIEGPGVVLKRVAVLCLEHLGFFYRTSWRAAMPAIWLVPVLAIFPAVAGLDAIPLMLLVCGGAVLWGLVTVRTHAVFAVVVDRLRITPLESLDVQESFVTLNRRLGLDGQAGVVGSLRRLAVFYTKCEMSAPAGQGDLAFQIALHEGRQPGELKDRCRLLSATVKKAYDRVRVLILASVLVVPVFQGYLLFSVGALAGLPRGEAFVVSMAAVVVLLPVTAMIVNPLLSPALALLYFRARQANGEDVALSASAGWRL